MPNSADKPDFPEGYKLWLQDTFDVEVDGRLIQHYETVSNKAASNIEQWDVWKEINDKLRAFDSKYKIKYRYPLVSEYHPIIITKPFDSFFEKTYLGNISNNVDYPKPPQGGWLVPPSWFSEINDIVRTTLVVKYLDGIQFLINEISSIANANNVDSHHKLVAKEEGYYAGHLYLEVFVEIPKINWDTEIRKFSFEIQVTTQIKEVIKGLLHTYYETRRLRKGLRNTDWRWDYKSDEFIANYLGHVMHYLEGMILEVRDRSMENKDET